MLHGDRLAEERRARLAAELMLEQVQAELWAANRKIAATNRALSDEIVVQREEVETVRHVAESLRDENLAVRSTLERAESAIMIAERRLWDSLETIQDGFAVFDGDRVMVAANRAYLAAFDGLEMVGPGIHYHEMLRLMCEEGIVDLENTGAEDWREMMIARWNAERIDPVIVKLWNGSFIKVIDRRTRDGDMVSLGLNITSTIKREAELERARARAEAANRAKSAFLANMSHEIRTPMNGVIGMADMLSETNLDEEQRLFVETIRNSGEALLVIINDVLDYSKIEAKKLELHPARFDLERCIHEVLMLLQPSAHDKGLQLAVDYDMFMPTEFVGDPGRVRQILTNLAGNAVKFTEAGHVAIRVVGLPLREGTHWRVHVTVEDTGIGIPREKLKSIFGEFSQVEDERNRRYDGTGLGLAITKRLVELMDGEIWVDSEVNVGSGFGFHITMPVAEGAASPPISAPDWIRRAIVVDEPQMTRAILTKQLAAMGLQAVSVRAGAEFEGLGPGPQDVVVLGDLHLAQEIASRLAGRAAPHVVALASTPVAGSSLPGVAATIRKPAQRREIARVLGLLPPPVSQGAPDGETGNRPHPAAAEPSRPMATEASATPPVVAAPPPVGRPDPQPSADGAQEAAARPAAGENCADEAEPKDPPERRFPQPEQEGAGAFVDAASRSPGDGPPPAGMGETTPATPVAPAATGTPEAGAVTLDMSTERPAQELPPDPEQEWANGVFRWNEEGPAQAHGAAAVTLSTDLPPVSHAGPSRGTAETAFPPVVGQDPRPGGPSAPQQPTDVLVAPDSADWTARPAPDADPTSGTEGAPGPASHVGASVALARHEAADAAPGATGAADVLAPGVGLPPDGSTSRDDGPGPLSTLNSLAIPCDAPGLRETAGSGAAAPGVTSAPAPVPLPPPGEAAGEAPRMRAMRILAAEDNKTNRLVFSKMLQPFDIDLEFAENGRDAVAAFESDLPDLIFTDISMPEMDGKEATRRIRAIEAARGLPRTPIVAITAHAMAGDAEEILAAGIDSYLTKPLKRADLVEAIRGAVPPGVRDPFAGPGPARETRDEATEWHDGGQPPDAPIVNFVAE